MKKYPFEQSFYVFLSFAAVGGFLEAYTYLLHGGVFCNAQTGNLVLLAIHLFGGRFSEATHYLCSILAYLAGIFVSIVLSRLLKASTARIAVTAAELCALAALAFIPESASNWYTYVSVAFLCALQYNIFTECRGAALSTTFCTNNLRQAAINLYKGAAEKDGEKLKKLDAELRDVYARIMQNEHMAAYNAAKTELDKVTNAISGMIAMAMQGEDPAAYQEHSCSGSCSGCSGCH